MPPIQIPVAQAGGPKAPSGFAPFKATFQGGNTTPLVLPLNVIYTYDFVVDWGDGSSTHVTSPVGVDHIHTYADDAAYQISITGTMPAWSFGNVPASRDNLISVDAWGDIAWQDMASAFLQCGSLASIPSGGNFSAVTDFSNCWALCVSLTSFPALDLSLGINFAGAFGDCHTLVTFGACNLSSGQDFSYAWYNNYSMVGFPAIDFASGTTFVMTWAGCSTLYSMDACNLSLGSDFSSAFSGCVSLASNVAFGMVADISFVDCAFVDSSAIDTLYNNLAPASATISMDGAGNTGFAGSDQTIATNKGWAVV